MHCNAYPTMTTSARPGSCRGCAAVPAPATAQDLRLLAERAGNELATASATEILSWAVQQFGADWCVASSMADAVLAHLASRVLPGVDVIFLDTGYHFAETIGMRDAVGAVLPVSVRTALPLRTVAEQDAEFGPRLHERDPRRLLRDAQGRAAEPGAGPVPGLGVRAAPGRLGRPRREPRWSSGTPSTRW